MELDKEFQGTNIIQDAFEFSKFLVTISEYFCCLL